MIDALSAGPAPTDLDAVLALSSLAPDEVTAVVVGAVLGVSALVGAGVGLVRRARRSPGSGGPWRPQPGVDYRPGVGDDAEEPRDTPVRDVETLALPDDGGSTAIGDASHGSAYESCPLSRNGRVLVKNSDGLGISSAPASEIPSGTSTAAASR